MMLYDKPIFKTMGDRSLLAEFGDTIDPRTNEKVNALSTGVDNCKIEGIRELIPSYRSLLIVFDPLLIAAEELQRRIIDISAHLDQVDLAAPKTLEIPVLYGGEDGPDLEWVAGYHHTTPQEIIRRHTEPTYRVYMIGFTPGYPYMGDLPDDLVTPRRETPRMKIPKGSVGIAWKQTGIYPVASPGGWQIIGRTTTDLFDPCSHPPALLEMGDRVKSYAVTMGDLNNGSRRYV